MTHIVLLARLRISVRWRYGSYAVRAWAGTSPWTHAKRAPAITLAGCARALYARIGPPC